MSVRTAMALLVMLLTGLSASSVVAESQEPRTTIPGEPAIDGCSPVSYFTKGIPEQGSAEFAVRIDGRTWYLASEHQRELFLEDPSSYLPRYGEYCPCNLALGRVQPIDPTSFRIVAGQLLLFHKSKEQDGLAAWKRSSLSEQELMRRADARLKLLEFRGFRCGAFVASFLLVEARRRWAGIAARKPLSLSSRQAGGKPIGTTRDPCPPPRRTAGTGS